MTSDRHTLAELRDRAATLGRPELADRCTEYIEAREEGRRAILEASSHRYISSLPRTPGVAYTSLAASGHPRPKAA